MTALIMDNGIKVTQISDHELLGEFITPLLQLIEGRGIKGTLIVDFSQVSVDRDSVESSIRSTKQNYRDNLSCLITRY